MACYPPWDAIIGVRYTHDHLEVAFLDHYAFETLEPDVVGETSFNNVSPRFATRYAFRPGQSLYASIASAYKAGGIDRVGAPRFTMRRFEEERLWNYEIGAKGSSFGRRLYYSAALFFSDWHDLQAQVNVLADPNDVSSAHELTLNAEGAQSLALEA